jgi:micrococcal nuclease
MIPWGARSPLYHYAMTVARVIDGDTLLCDIDLGFNIRARDYVRLFGVNTPEIYGTKATPDGTLAREYVLLWLTGRYDLTLHSRKYDEREKYGRILGTVYNGNEAESLNDALVREGHVVV